jgi:secreted trypsin-like serine protease
MVMRINSAVTGVTPVTLNSNSQVPANGDTLTVIGFGDLKSGAGSYPTFLQEVDVPFVPQDKCNQQYAGGIDSSTMICAGLDQGGKDSCQGDSGGPLLKIVNGVHTQVGIVSWGNGCALAGSPGVYSRVSGQLTWIQSEVCRLTKTNPKPAYCSGTTGTGGTGTGGTGGQDWRYWRNRNWRYRRNWNSSLCG